MARMQEQALNAVVAEALAHHRRGEAQAAEACYREALSLAPQHALIKHNLAVLMASQGQIEAALVSFDEVIAAEPGYAAAHYNRAVALKAAGRSHEAILGFAQACRLEAGHYDAHRALGFLRLAAGERGRALDHFARTYELRRGEDRSGVAAKSLEFATRGKLQHDCEQFRFLSARLRNGERFEALARAYAEVAKDFPEEVTRLSDGQLQLLGGDYNTALHIRSTPEIAPRAVGARTDGESIAAKLADPHGGVGVCDDLLMPAALQALRRHLLESTIWHDFSHIGRFVASYLEDGLACPLLLQIADELRSVFPALLKDHPLTQAWAFKALESGAVIEAHADDAAVTVNLWLTPTVANLDPAKGGLTVCPVSPPAGWELSGYDHDRERAVIFLKQHRSELIKVTYRENRAVVFRSKLLHLSDSPRFDIGYENQRVNLTFLFGRPNAALGRIGPGFEMALAKHDLPTIPKLTQRPASL
jgi:tetratricopeptide (TPR) repeat protein